MSTAAATGIAVDFAFHAHHSGDHWPKDCAPSAGLNCRVNRPSPAARNAFPQRTLQARHCQILFLGVSSSSWPLTWPISIFRPLPHMQQSRAVEVASVLGRAGRRRGQEADGLPGSIEGIRIAYYEVRAPGACTLPLSMWFMDFFGWRDWVLSSDDFTIGFAVQKYQESFREHAHAALLVS